MYSDLYRAAQLKREITILRRLFPESNEDDLSFILDIAQNYCRLPSDRIEVVATATRLLSELERPWPIVPLE